MAYVLPVQGWQFTAARVHGLDGHQLEHEGTVGPRTVTVGPGFERAGVDPNIQLGGATLRTGDAPDAL